MIQYGILLCNLFYAGIVIKSTVQVLTCHIELEIVNGTGFLRHCWLVRWFLIASFCPSEVGVEQCLDPGSGVFFLPRIR